MVHPGVNAAPGIFAIIMVLFVVAMAVAVAVFMLFLWWRIFSKAGYSGALGLLMFVPFGILIMLCILAFSQWPILNKEV